jgi:hypothetical protein
LNLFNLLTLPLFNPIALHHLGERSKSVVTVPLQNQGSISKEGEEILDGEQVGQGTPPNVQGAGI